MFPIVSLKILLISYFCLTIPTNLYMCIVFAKYYRILNGNTADSKQKSRLIVEPCLTNGIVSLNNTLCCV